MQETVKLAELRTALLGLAREHVTGYAGPGFMEFLEVVRLQFGVSSNMFDMIYRAQYGIAEKEFIIELEKAAGRTEQLAVLMAA